MGRFAVRGFVASTGTVGAVVALLLTGASAPSHQHHRAGAQWWAMAEGGAVAWRAPLSADDSTSSGSISLDPATALGVDGSPSPQAAPPAAPTADPAAPKQASQTATPESAPKPAPDSAKQQLDPTAPPRDLAKSMTLRRGWSVGQWSCLSELWTRESQFTVDARNGRSGAYGIPQALPGHKMASAGPDWRTNPITQIRWGLNYIKDRYGSPCGAWSFWRQHNWY